MKTSKSHKNTNLNSEVSDNKFRDILLLSYDWIWEIDLEGKFIYTSGQIKKILGYNPDEIIGKTVYDLFIPENREQKRKEIEKLIACEKPINNRINWNLSKDGKRVCLLTNGIPVYDKKGKLLAYRGVDKDITDQKKVEEKLQKEIAKKNAIEIELQLAKDKAEEIAKSKIDFIKKLSHEVRTPMNGIIGTSILLKETKITDEQKEFLNIIESSANSLLSIINDVLSLSEIESGSYNIDKQNFNLIDKLNQIERHFAGISKYKRINFSINIKPGVPKFLHGDFDRMMQILKRLIDNAFKFTKQGSIIVNIEKKEENKDYVELVFKVIDTGIGIEQKLKEGLFDELRHGKFGLTKIHGGTGLGLLICKQLTKVLGGDIGVESEPGQGSKFWFTIKFKHGNNPSPAPMSKPTEEESKKKDSLRILVAEDNIINQKVAMVNLKQLGHEVEIAVNGKMALEMFRKNRYDLILMDIQMPVMDGLTATKEIRKLEKEEKINKPIIIVAITANASEEDRQNCISNGMNHYIIKPFKPEDLDKAISLIV